MQVLWCGSQQNRSEYGFASLGFSSKWAATNLSTFAPLRVRRHFCAVAEGAAAAAPPEAPKKVSWDC